MNIFELTATLGLDTGGFMSGIDIAKGALDGLTSAVDMTAGAVIDFGKNVLETGLEYDKNLGAVYALTGATDEYSRKLFESTVLSEAAASTFTTAEVAGAGVYEALAGWDLSESTAALHGIVVTAEAAGEELQPISDIITDVTTAFHDNAGESEHYGDVFAAAATNANTTITQMGEALKMVGPIAGSLGYSIEDVAVWMQLMGDNAIKGGTAGRALRNVITRIGTDAGATESKLGALGIATQRLGVQFYDTEGNVRPLLDVTNELRDSWHGLSDTEKNELTESLGGFDTAMENLKADISTVNSMYDEWSKTSDNSKEYLIDDINEIIDAYQPLYDALNIDLSQTYLENKLDVLENRLTGLNDKQQIEYGKQMASLQGMSALIAVMNTNAEDYQAAIDAVYNAEGAAEKMRNDRLDNLWGDIEHFNSSFNTMTTIIYDDVKGPFREAVQEGTTAIDNITKAISKDGLMGGIDALAKEIGDLAENDHVKSLLEKAGNLLGSLFGGIVDKILPKIRTAAPDIMDAFLSGAADSLSGSNGGLTKLVGVAAGAISGLTKNDNGIMGIFQNAFGIKPVANIDDIQAALDKAEENGDLYVTVNDVQFPASMDAVTIMDSLIAATDACVTQGIADGAVNGEEIMDQSADTIGESLSTALGDAGADGAATAAVDIEDILNQTAETVANFLSTTIGNSGIDAGNTFADYLQAAIGNRTYSINVQANVSGLPVQQNARAMSGGRIFNRGTIFGYADGAFQVAGDAGPEAVVGVNSLERMIQNAVGYALGGQAFSVPVQDDRPVQIVFEVDGMQKWVYNAMQRESQRVGLKFSEAL